MRRRRTQEGRVFRDHGAWFVRYYVDQAIDGVVARRRVTKRLGGDREMSAPRARAEAKRLLAQVNASNLPPEHALTLGAFVVSRYFPHIERQGLRPSTVRGYRVIWDKQVKSYCAHLWIREVNTAAMQTILEQLAATGRVNSNSMKHAKSFLSGVFRFAIQQGYYEGNQNPVHQTSVPKVRGATETHGYSLEEIFDMLAVVPEPAATVIATAAFTGARRGEIRGMSWEHYKDGEIQISHSVWQSHVTEPKSEKSKAPVPIIAPLAARLEMHRLRLGNPACGPIFRNEAGKPMDLNNLLGRIIQPVLNRCEVCNKSESQHNAGSDHQYRRDSSLPEWHGWHAFRRGLATNLYRLGVPDKTVQAILRHADVATTMKCYVKTSRPDVKDAMKKFETELQNRLSDSKWAAADSGLASPRKM